MIDFEKKDSLIKQIRSFHPGDRPERFKHFGVYVGGMKDEGNWHYEVMLRSSIDDLEKCLELLRKNQDYRQKFKPSWTGMIKVSDELIFMKLAGLSEKAKCPECHLEQNLYNKKQLLQNDSNCNYCGTDLK